MDVDRSLVDIDAVAPHPIEELFSGKDPARCKHHELQQAVFSRSKPKALTFPVDLVLLAIEQQFPYRQNM